MKSLFDSDEKKPREVFKDAVSWDMPEVQGDVINKTLKPEKKIELDDVRQFEERIKKQIEQIQRRKDNPTYLTVSQLQEIQKQAYDEAYQQGYEEAYKKGTADADNFLKKQTESQRQDLQQKAAQLQHAFDALAKPLEDVDKAVEQQLTEMVYYLVRQILDFELATNPAHITRVLQQAISRLPMSQRNVLIKLNPADVKLLQENEITIEGHEWRLEADDKIAAGGCLVESESVRIDRRLETRMKDLVKHLFTGLEQPSLDIVDEDSLTPLGDDDLEVSDE